MSHPQVLSINISKKKGTFKFPVKKANLLPGIGIVGDAHAKNWHRMLSLLTLESIQIMEKINSTINLKPGSFAENITTTGIVLHTLPIGTELYLGKIKVKITQIGKKCHNNCNIHQKIGKCIMPKQGVFAKILNPGILSIGDNIKIIS